MKWLIALLFVFVPLSAWAQQCTQAQLNTEFTTDPTVRGYAGCAGVGGLAGVNVNDQCILDLFNAPCTNNAACKVDVVVSREQLYEVIDHDELATGVNAVVADATRKWLLEIAMRNVSFNLSDIDVRQKLFDIFTAPKAPTTNAAITSLRQRDTTRAQIVCGRQGTLADITRGLRG